MYEDPLSLSSTAFSQYVPLWNISQLNLGTREYLNYNKPSLTSGVNTGRNTIAQIRTALESNCTVSMIAMYGKDFYLTKGMILDHSGKMLFCLAMKKEPFLKGLHRLPEEVSREDVNTFSYNNLVLFYSSTFFTDSTLSTFNRRLQKEFVDSCYIKGIEVRIMTPIQIEENTFARIPNRKFKSLSALEKHMKEVLPTFLYGPQDEKTLELDYPIEVKREKKLDPFLAYRGLPKPVAAPEEVIDFLNRDFEATKARVIAQMRMARKAELGLSSIVASSTPEEVLDIISERVTRREAARNVTESLVTVAPITLIDDTITLIDDTEVLPIHEEALLYDTGAITAETPEQEALRIEAEELGFV